jgi:putative transposase
MVEQLTSRILQGCRGQATVVDPVNVLVELHLEVGAHQLAQLVLPQSCQFFVVPRDLSAGCEISGESTSPLRATLGIWIEQTEGAKFWLKVMNELKTRGVQDILIVCCDGLKGFPDAIENVFPKATVQTCIVHMIRNSLRYVSFKDRKAVVKDLKPIYTAANRADAEAALAAFEAKWGRRYEMISGSWRTNWERVVPFLDFPPEIRRVIYTTNQIEALNSSLRKLLQYRGHFPHDEAVTKILYLALRRMEKKWERTLWNWSAVLGQFAVFFQGRIPAL